MTKNNSGFDHTPKYRIKYVSKQTGISPITLRAWERRYQILAPCREENRYRLYSEEDIQSLKWCKAQVDNGIAISQAASELREQLIIGNLPIANDNFPQITENYDSNIDAGSVSNQLFDLLINQDELAAQAIFDQAITKFPLLQLLEKVIIPLLIRLGEHWFTGMITVATEHFASAFLLSNLMSIFRRLPIRKNKPKILVGGAPGELHELGPLMIAVLLRESGYYVEFLGPDLPLDDLVLYIKDEKPAMVCLSATMEQSALSLRGLKKQVAIIKPPPIFAYGGGAFVSNPSLVEKIPGEFLGNTMRESLERIKQLV